jgi:hypothetical protein
MLLYKTFLPQNGHGKLARFTLENTTTISCSDGTKNFANINTSLQNFFATK